MSLHDIDEPRNRRATDPSNIHNQRPRSGGVKFDSTINLGHVLTFIGFIGTGIIAWFAMDKRVVIIEERYAMQVLIDKRQDNSIEENKKITREDVKEIIVKLDRLIERKP